MWTCVSKLRLRRETAICLLLLAAAGLAFAAGQNQGWIVGGAIAIPKLLWLQYALFAWFVLPVLLARDCAAPCAIRRLFQLFFYNMALRGIVEIVMMYAWKNWHPYYGVAHDLFSIGLLLWLALRVRPLSRFDAMLTRHAFVLAAMFCAEIGFALYFAFHFATQGEKAVYYVPADRRYSDILVSTAVAVACLTLYFSWFLRRWLYAADEGGSLAS